MNPEVLGEIAEEPDDLLRVSYTHTEVPGEIAEKPDDLLRVPYVNAEVLAEIVEAPCDIAPVLRNFLGGLRDRQESASALGFAPPEPGHRLLLAGEERAPERDARRLDDPPRLEPDRRIRDHVRHP